MAHFYVVPLVCKLFFYFQVELDEGCRLPVLLTSGEGWRKYFNHENPLHIPVKQVVTFLKAFLSHQ